MKRIHRITTGLAVLVMASSVQAALIVISDDKPSEYVVEENDPDGAQDAGLYAEGVGIGAYAVGQAFTVDEGGVVVDAISLQSGSTYTAENAQFKIALFDMNDYTIGLDNPFGTFTDPFAGQTTQPIYVETFDVSDAVAAGQWVTFDLTTNPTLVDAGYYGFLVWLAEPSLASWNFRGQWPNNPDIYADGTRLRVTETGGNTAPTGDLNFVIQTIPEPATLSLLAACGAAVLLIRRRFII